ncbi:MAG: phosphate ABC transporter permease PstA [Deltaproteobacteria bacterium]|nr:phosphate ABC transporter permease PstA [Deltaproteobacteria bacterium]
MDKFRYARRKFKDRLFAFLCFAASLLSVSVLLLVLGYVVYQGASGLNLDFFTHLPAPVGETGGGMSNAIVGSLMMIAIASCIGIPIGIGAGLYLAEYGNNPFGKTVRYLTDVLNGLPSIVMGLFAYALFVIPMKGFSGLAGGVALSILMIPVIVRTTEEVVKLVPHSLREGALALGIPRWKVILRVVVSTAKGGIVTAVVLSIARIMGETAPLLFTAFGNQFWQTNVLQPMAALTLQIFTYAISPYDEWHAKAWTGALVLVSMSLLINLIARLAISKGFRKNS